MRSFFLIILLLSCCTFALSQKPDDILATATDTVIRVSDLPEHVGKHYLEQDKAVNDERTRLLSMFINDVVIDVEAGTPASRNAVIEAEYKKIEPPTAEEIKRVFDANQRVFGEITLEQAKPQIVGFLRVNAEEKALSELVEKLKTKHKFTLGKDVNAAGLKASDVIFSLTGRPVTAGEFDARYKAFFYDVRASIYADVMYVLNDVIFSAVAGLEARSRNIDISDLIAAEITDKMRDYTDEERIDLQTSLNTKLYEKYKVKVTFAEPDPVAHDIKAGKPRIYGGASAPVTITMFSDLQCSACASTHPIMKKLIADNAGRVNLSIRDLPLESIHPDAFTAALAARAAGEQGKYFEFIDILYGNQQKLDRESLLEYAKGLGLNLRQFQIDFTDEKTALSVREDIEQARRLDINSTPTLFVNGVRVHHFTNEHIQKMITRAAAKPQTNK